MIFFLSIIKKGSKSRIQELLLTSSRPTRCLHLKYSWYLYNTCWIHINLIPNKSGFVESNNWEMDVIVCYFVLGIHKWAAMKALLCLCLGDRIGCDGRRPICRTKCSFFVWKERFCHLKAKYSKNKIDFKFKFQLKLQEFSIFSDKIRVQLINNQILRFTKDFSVNFPLKFEVLAHKIMIFSGQTSDLN